MTHERECHSKAKMGFIYHVFVRKPDGRIEQEETTHNVIPLEGLNFNQSVMFKGAVPVPTWYMGVFEGNYFPNANTKASTIAAEATECSTYELPTRVEFNEGAVSNGAVDNSLNPALFTINGLATKTLYGGFIGSASAKGAITGVLISAVRFSSPKVLDPGDTLQVIAGNALASA